jgi:serine transporter
METTQTSTIASKDSRSAWRKTDTMWMLGLYGTAIGAGVLFLPINAGVGGMIPLIIMAILAFPMTFFAHRGLTRFVLSGKNPGEDITEVVEEHFGIGAGKLITLLYFFAIYPILLVYSVAITNTVESFMSHQLGMTPPPRAILSLILIVGMMTIVRFGEQMIVKAMSILVFPFVGVLMLLALYLIRSGTAQHWKRCLWTLHLQPERSVDDPVAGNSGNGVLVQPLSDHLFFRRCEA